MMDCKETLLVAAVEARLSPGDSLQQAAQTECKDAAKATETLFPGGHVRPEQQLLSVRKKLRTTVPPGPREGMHLTAWKTSLAEIEKAINLPPESRQPQLGQIYAGLIDLAEKQTL